MESDVWVGLVVGTRLPLVAPLHSTKKAMEENSEREVGGKEGERIESNFPELFFGMALLRCSNQISQAQLTHTRYFGPSSVPYYILGPVRSSLILWVKRFSLNKLNMAC